MRFGGKMPYHVVNRNLDLKGINYIKIKFYLHYFQDKNHEENKIYSPDK